MIGNDKYVYKDLTQSSQMSVSDTLPESYDSPQNTVILVDNENLPKGSELADCQISASTVDQNVSEPSNRHNGHGVSKRNGMPNLNELETLDVAHLLTEPDDEDSNPCADNASSTSDAKNKIVGEGLSTDEIKSKVESETLVDGSNVQNDESSVCPQSTEIPSNGTPTNNAAQTSNDIEGSPSQHDLSDHSASFFSLDQEAVENSPRQVSFGTENDVESIEEEPKINYLIEEDAENDSDNDLFTTQKESRRASGEFSLQLSEFLTQSQPFSQKSQGHGKNMSSEENHEQTKILEDNADGFGPENISFEDFIASCEVDEKPNDGKVNGVNDIEKAVKEKQEADNEANHDLNSNDKLDNDIVNEEKTNNERGNTSEQKVENEVKIITDQEMNKDKINTDSSEITNAVTDKNGGGDKLKQIEENNLTQSQAAEVCNENTSSVTKQVDISEAVPILPKITDDGASTSCSETSVKINKKADSSGNETTNGHNALNNCFEITISQSDKVLSDIVGNNHDTKTNGEKPQQIPLCNDIIPSSPPPISFKICPDSDITPDIVSFDPDADPEPIKLPNPEKVVQKASFVNTPEATTSDVIIDDSVRDITVDIPEEATMDFINR